MIDREFRTNSSLPKRPREFCVSCPVQWMQVSLNVCVSPEGRRTGPRGFAMRMKVLFVPIVLALILVPLLPVHAGGTNPTGRAAVLPPISHGRPAALMPIAGGTSATLPAVTRGSAALKPVTVGRPAALKPLTVDRAARMKTATLERPTAPRRTTVKGPGLLPVSEETGAVETGKALGLKEIAAGETLTAGLQRTAVPGMVHGREAVLPDHILRGSDLPVFTFNDGYVLPFEARALVRRGYFNETYYNNACSRTGFNYAHNRLNQTFNRNGWGRTRLVRGGGSGYWAMNRLDSCGPQWFYRSSYRRRGCLPGRFVGDFYFPLGYYLRPMRHGSMRYNKSSWPILVPWNCAEVVPDDFQRTLRKSNFPMVMGDMAFKDGNYVQAALAFRDALDRRAKATAAGAFAFGDALIGLRNYKYAENSIRNALVLAPTWADKLDRNGVYGKKGDLAKHLAEVEQFTKDYRKVASGWFLLGYLRMTSGDIGEREKATTAFEMLLELQPGDELGRRYINLLKNERREIDLEIGDDVMTEPTVAKKD